MRMISLVKRKLGPEELKSASSLLKGCPIFPGAHSLPERAKYFSSNMYYHLRKNKKNHFLLVKGGKDILGMASLRSMEWDSKFFKIPMGCIEHILISEEVERSQAGKIEKLLLNESFVLAKKLGIKVLYISVNSAQASLAVLLASSGCNFLCAEMERISGRGELPYLSSGKRLNRKYIFRKYRKEDYPQVMKIAGEIAQDISSKFSLNPYLPQEEKYGYYLESIKNCCLGLNADEMFVAVKDTAIIGFIAYRYDKIFQASLGKRMAFLVMGGILRSERKKYMGTYFFTWAHKQIFKNSEVILGRAYLHNPSMIRFIMKRWAHPLPRFVYTFCKKL
jgi:hypothetical protein